MTERTLNACRVAAEVASAEAEAENAEEKLEKAENQIAELEQKLRAAIAVKLR